MQFETTQIEKHKSSRRRALILIVSLIATVAVVRGFLLFYPDTDLNVGAYNIHHLFTGILFITLFGTAAILCKGDSRAGEIATAGFAVGLGLALDEWIYLIATDGSNASYLLPISHIGAGLMIGAACFYTLFFYWFGRRKNII